MNWEQYRQVMERSAIKIDNMAAEDSYFMATHMPFPLLEVYRGGHTSDTSVMMTEDEVFERLIYNPENEHRMIIVRGDNGTGKSHLIRFLKAKFETSSSVIYNPQHEQLVFLRRLNNSVRGVFAQLIDQQVIKDPEIEGKLRKFVASSESKDEAAFKTDILYAYVAAVSNDVSNKFYKPVNCRNIASFLSDSRIMDHLLREGGAISKCYSLITAPSSQVLKNVTIFSEEDFDVPKILRQVVRQGDPQAVDFATSLKGDEIELQKFIKYLNGFTREVVQRCADISSEGTKSMFEHLRKDLKRQGKNLTLFIEDFTGFTGIDSELITVLSTEHGGDYADLCRVTAIIGITNDYYDQFRDNFKDRVTHQISVTEQSFGTEDFLTNMAGRYLNAIYCEPSAMTRWYDSGAHMEDLPISDFEPPCPWESTELEGHNVTLYPFNRRSLVALYNNLPVRSPRTFLRDILRAQLKEYFDGKLYGEDWAFPLNPSHISMTRDQHSSSIDRLEGLSMRDKERLKALFAIWGDGTAAGVKEKDGYITFGQLDKRFLDDIGLGMFIGIGDIRDTDSGESAKPTANPSQSQPAPQPKQQETPVAKREDPAVKEYRRFKEDINNWYSNGGTLKYHADYRKWLSNFLCGDRSQCGAINWQDIGIPAYIVAERLTDVSAYYIEGQDVEENPENIPIVMERSVESRDALLALNELQLAKGWEFDGAAYYQQRLIAWMERRKDQFIQRAILSSSIEQQPPMLEWGLALQFLRLLILRQKPDTSDSINLLETLVNPPSKQDTRPSSTEEWNNLIQFLSTREAELENARMLLQKASATTMGSVMFSRDKETARFYRVNELMEALGDLMIKSWDPSTLLPGKTPAKSLVHLPANQLKELIPRVEKVMVAEDAQAESTIQALTEFAGELDKDHLLEMLNSIKSFFSELQQSGVLGHTALIGYFEQAPVDMTNSILSKVKKLESAKGKTIIEKLTIYSGSDLAELMRAVGKLNEVEKLATSEGKKARDELEKLGIGGQHDELSQEVQEALNELYDRLEKMEVKDDAE